MADFNEAIKIVLNHEGAYINDPDDNGGETKYGICKKYHPDIDIMSLTVHAASEIYKKEYWNVIRGNEIDNQKIANKLMDICVLIGTKKAVKFIQLAIKKAYCTTIEIDGIIGNITLGFLNMGNTMKEVIYDNFIKIVDDYLIKLDQPKFIKGWLLRLHS